MARKRPAVFKWILFAFLGWVLWCVVASEFNRDGLLREMKQPPGGKELKFRKIKHNEPKEDEPVGDDLAALLIMQKAHVLGRSMARGGAIKPNSEQIDALSRRAQTAADDTHSRGWFKLYFELGFWDGWKSR